ncbi:MAG: hypothetical protein Ct9H300mP14_07670 [Gammaproteobacteria bacterium]|nr:MAG: hypothetical protein Ct9H300mP14_07670 [Gammaproteobacteria bacterium]
MSQFDLPRRLVAETLGTALLLATVVGSGIMAENLAGGNVAIALLGNTIPTGAILVVLITIFGPVSGPSFQPCSHPVVSHPSGNHHQRSRRLRCSTDHRRNNWYLVRTPNV